jgi:hypothetical protein
MAKKVKKSIKQEQPKSELDNLTLADGKINKDSDIEKLKNLEEILGVKKMNPFGTTNMDIFLERLSEMTNIDLQNMCERVGIFASGSRMQIKEKLIREFKSFNKGSLSMTVQGPAFELDPTNPAHKEALKNLRLP